MVAASVSHERVPHACGMLLAPWEGGHWLWVQGRGLACWLLEDFVEAASWAEKVKGRMWLL